MGKSRCESKEVPKRRPSVEMKESTDDLCSEKIRHQNTIQSICTEGYDPNNLRQIAVLILNDMKYFISIISQIILLCAEQVNLQCYTISAENHIST